MKGIENGYVSRCVTLFTRIDIDNVNGIINIRDSYHGAKNNHTYWSFTVWVLAFNLGRR